MRVATAITRQQVEDFLFAEADLLDSWKLNEWLALFDPERGGYYIPTMDAPNADHTKALYLIADDMVRLKSRVAQLLSGTTWAEKPPSRTNHLISNVRITVQEGEAI